MKTGIELIAEERKEQIEKHGYNTENDVKYNSSYQLSSAASVLCLEDRHTLEPDDCCPLHWNEPLWEKMFNKEYKDRLILAGALIVAEIDRLTFIETGQEHNQK